MPFNKTYISTVLSKHFDQQLFQLAALKCYSDAYQKIITIPNQNDFIRECKLFDEILIEDYHVIKDNQETFKIIPFGINILLEGKFINFRPHTEATLEFMREVIYANEDYMYAAYNKYNEIKKYFDTCSDDDMVSIYYDSDNELSYYMKSIILMNKKNVVLFVPQEPDKSLLKQLFNDTHKIYICWEENPYIRFILLSFFKHNIINKSEPYFSLWAAYISRYDSVKTLVVSEFLRSIMNAQINNLNINYLE